MLTRRPPPGDASRAGSRWRISRTRGAASRSMRSARATPPRRLRPRGCASSRSAGLRRAAVGRHPRTGRSRPGSGLATGVPARSCGVLPAPDGDAEVVGVGAEAFDDELGLTALPSARGGDGGDESTEGEGVITAPVWLRGALGRPVEQHEIKVPRLWSRGRFGSAVTAADAQARVEADTSAGAGQTGSVAR